MCVAPSFAAIARRSGTTSTTTIGFAPSRTAPRTLDSPTPPAPKITMPSPAHLPTTFSTAPTPVTTAHPAIAAISDGTSAGTGTRARSETTQYSAKQETPSR